MLKRLLGKGLWLNGAWVSQALFNFLIHWVLDPNLAQYFSVALFLLVGILFILYLPKMKEESLGIFWLILGVFLNYGLLPFFENDFYRYFFEGKAILLGLNPYNNSPLSLQGEFSYPTFFSIGYPSLSSVYPPLALIFFGLFSFLPFKMTLFIFSLVNALLIYALINYLSNHKPFPKRFLPITLLFLQRELCLQYHFELWALFPFLVAIFSQKSWVRIFGFSLSFHLKFLGIIGLFFLALKRYFRETVIFFLVIFSSLTVFFILKIHLSNGLIAFQEKWLFAPGFINILLNVFSLDFNQAKLMSAFCFILCFYFMSKRRDPEIKLLILIVCFFYFSPVYNAWYALWPGVLLLSFGFSSGAWYLALSPLCYAYFLVSSEYLFSINLILHIPFYFFVKEIFTDQRSFVSFKFQS